MGKHINAKSDDLIEEIQRYIAEHDMKADDKLPSERIFAEELNTSRVTLRVALQKLKSLGIIHTKHGSGNYISKERLVEDAKSFMSYSKTWKATGHNVETELITSGIAEVSHKINAALGIKDGDLVFQLIRIRKIDGELVSIQKAYLAADQFPGIEQYDFEKESLHELMCSKYGVKLSYQEQQYSITHLRKNEAAWLDVDTASAAFMVIGTTFDVNDKPVEYSISINRGDRYSVSAWLEKRRV